MKGHSPLRKTLTGFNTQHPLIQHIKDHYLRDYQQHSKISNRSKNSVRTNRGRWLWLLSSWAHCYNRTKQVYTYPNVLGRCWPITHLHATQKTQHKSKNQEATKRSVIIGSCHWNALCHLWAKQKAEEDSPIGKTWPTKIRTLFPATLMYSFSCERIHFKRSLKVFNWLLNFKRAMRKNERKVNSATVKSLHSRSHKALEDNTQGTQLSHWQASKWLVLGATSHKNWFKKKI